MTTNIEDKIKSFAFPILLGIVSFFMIALLNWVDKIYVEVKEIKETVIEVKIDTRYSKETIVDHGQRLRVLERSNINPTDNTRVRYEMYNN
jgi:hypothetical protein